MSRPAERPSLLSTIVGTVAVAALYFGGAWVADLHPLVPGSLSLIWLPAGIAWAAVLVGGWRMLGGVVIGAVAVGWWAGSTDFAIGVRALGAALGAFTGAFLLHYVFGFDGRMARASDALALGAVAFSVPFFTAGLAIGALALDHRVPATGLMWSWLAAWASRTIGILLVVPLVLAAAHAWRGGASRGVFGGPRGRARRLKEGALLLALTFGAAAAVWTGRMPAGIAAVAVFATIPFIAWAGHRVGPGMVAMLTAVLAVFGIIGTLAGNGPFAGGTGEGLYPLYAFLGLTGTTGYVLAGVVGERETEARSKRASEQRWRDLIESSPDVLLTVDRKGGVLFCNRDGPGAMRPNQERHTLFDLVDEDDRTALQDRLDLVFVNGVVTRIDVRAVGTRNIPRHFVLQLAPIRRGENIDRAMIIAQDVTEHKRAEAKLRESEARVQAFFDRSPAPILILDKEGGFLQANQAARRLLDAHNVDLTGFGLLDVLAPDERVQGLSWLQDLQLGQRDRVEGETVVRTAKGDPVDVRLNFTAVRGEGTEPDFVVAILEDIRAAHRAQKAEALAQQRQTEIGELEEVSAWKSQLLNIASHELRNPLTPMKLQMELLSSGLYGELNEKQHKTIEKLQRESDRLANLVTGILDVARIETGHVSLEAQSVPARTILDDVVESFEDAASEWGVSLDLDVPEPLTVMADADRIKQVVFNLLSNAFKFTPKGGSVTVRAVRDEGNALVSVEDTGPGLTQEQIDRLFKAFSQVHDTRGGDTKKGIGLGLYITKGIVEAHGGTIDVTSPGPGEGTTFSFRLPLSTAAPPEEDVEAEVESEVGSAAAETSPEVPDATPEADPAPAGSDDRAAMLRAIDQATAGSSES